MAVAGDREYSKDGLGEDFVDFLQDLDKISKCVGRATESICECV